MLLEQPGEKTALATPEILLPLLEETPIIAETTWSSVTQPLPKTTTAVQSGTVSLYRYYSRYYKGKNV